MNTPKQIANYVKEYFLSKIGNNTLNGHIFVDTGDAYDLGSSSKPFRAVYATSLIGAPAGTDVLVAVQSGDTPGYLNDVLDIGSNLNKSISGGVLTISLIKTPLWTDGTNALTGNLSVNSGITIDGVDLSVFKSDYDSHIINPNAHHNKLHSIVDAAHHTATGAQFSVVGLSATNTLGILSTSSNGDLNTDTILRSSSTGNLKLTSLTTETIDSTANLTLAPTTDIILTPNDRVILSTDIKFELGSAGFASGFAGHGGRFDYNVSRSSKSTVEVDDMYVRGRLNVYELVIQQIRATNGNVFVSDSAKIDEAAFIIGTSYELTVDGDTNDYQPFAVGDIIRAQRVNLGSGIQVWQSNMEVLSISPGGNAKKFVASLISGDAPAAGMEFVRLGSSSDSSRRGTIYLTASDSNAPFIDILDGVTSHATFGASGTHKVRLGKLSGISDADFTMTGYGLYSTNAYLKGIVSVANDLLRLDSNGIRLKQAAGAFTDYGAYKFVDSSNNLIGGLYGAEIVQFGASYTNSMSLKVDPSTYGSLLSIYVTAGTGASQEARLSIGTYGNGVTTKSVNINFIAPGGASGDGYIQIGDSFSTSQYATNLIPLKAQANIIPLSDLGADLGDASHRWDTIYVDQIIATTISGTTMNGAEWEYSGNMVIDANSASNTTVSIVNQGAGVANLSVENNLTVGGDITVIGFVDGVDVASLSNSFSSHIVNANAHHNRDHVLATTSGLSGTTHTVSGLTAGQVLKATSATDARFIQLQHDELGGLTDDDHSIYVHNTIARTIGAVHTFNPSVAGAWITLGANATGQLITGLNSDLLDGYDSSAFPRKAENATISGGWTFSSTINIGTGAKINFFDEHADKLVFYSNTYGIGTESNYVTIWSPSAFRFRSGGTGVAIGTNVFEVQSSGAMLIGTDTDILSTIGRGKIGYMTGVADEFAISHIDFGTANTYMIKQTSTGNVMLNGVTGGYVDIRNANATKLKVDDTNTTISTNVGIGVTPTEALDVVGNFKLTGTITASSDTDSLHTLGKGKIGYITGVAGEFAISHFSFGTASNYMIKQTSSGNVMVNAPSGNYVDIRNNNSSIWKVASAGITLGASKSIVTNTFDSTTPISGFSINEITTNKYALTIGNITADELHVRTFVADETRIDRGDEWWGKGYGIVQTAWVTPTATDDNGVEVWFENAPSIVGGIFSDGDWIFIRLIDDLAGLEIFDIWGQVYSSPAGGVGGYAIETTPTYSVNRQRWRFVLRSGEVSYDVPVGVTAVNFGATGQAFINLSTVDAAGAPYIKMGRWSGSDPYSPSNRTTEVIIGKLTAIPGPTGSVGIYSAYGNSSFELSDAGALLKSLPIQSWNGANQTFNLSETGTDLWIGVSSGDKRLTWNGTTLAITGTVTATAGLIGGWAISGNTLTSTDFVIDAGGAKMSIGASTTFGTKGFQVERNGSFPRVYIGNGTTQYFQYDGTKITWAAANTSLDASGNLTATNASLSGNITASSGTIGGFNISTSTISATNLVLTAGAANSANITVGTGSNAGGLNSANAGSDIAIWAGSTFANRATAAFRVTAAGALTATSATVTGTITASAGSITGFLTIGTSGGIYQGTGTSGTPTTGLKIWNDSGIGRIAGYNSGTIQWYANTDGKLYAGGGNVVIDENGVTFPTGTTGSPITRLRYGSSTTEIGRVYAYAEGGGGVHQINVRAYNDAIEGVAHNKLAIQSPTWTDRVSMGLYGSVIESYGYITEPMFFGISESTLEAGTLSGNLSSIITQHNGTASSVSISNTNWGNAAHIGFNTYNVLQDASYDASGQWKYLGTQYTGNVTRAGRLSFDGNGGIFRFYVSEAGRTVGQDITTWTKIMEFGISSGSSSFGIFGATPVAKQTVTGSRGGNAALASLLTALANYGLITNSTSA